MDLGVSLGWEQEGSVVGDREGHSRVGLTLEREDSPWLESVVLVVLEVFDHEFLAGLVSVLAVASLEDHLFTVSLRVVEGDTEVLVHP